MVFPSPKIVKNLPRTCKGEPYQFRGKRDPLGQTYRHTKILLLYHKKKEILKANKLFVLKLLLEKIYISEAACN